MRRVERNEIRRRIPGPGAPRARWSNPITELAGGDEFKFMEVCGGHTHTIYRHGIEHLLPEVVELVHGPGCPVCVIPMGRVDDAMWLAEQPGVIFTTFGDMMRVPGSQGQPHRGQGARRGRAVRLLAARRAQSRRRQPRQARRVLRRRLRDDRAVHRGDAGPGPRARCHATSASSATTSRSFRRSRRSSNRPICGSSGFLGPGHVSTVVGLRPYRFVPEVYGKPHGGSGIRAARHPGVGAHAAAADPRRSLRGREPVHPRGAPGGQHPGAEADGRDVRAAAAFRVARAGFHLAERVEGASATTPNSTRSCKFDMPGVRVADPKACQCGEVLKGVIKPWECKVFGTACTPRRRSARAWSPPRARARPTTTSAGCTARPHSCWASAGS